MVISSSDHSPVDINVLYNITPSVLVSPSHTRLLFAKRIAMDSGTEHTMPTFTLKGSRREVIMPFNAFFLVIVGSIFCVTLLISAVKHPILPLCRYRFHNLISRVYLDNFWSH